MPQLRCGFQSEEPEKSLVENDDIITEEFEENVVLNAALAETVSEYVSFLFNCRLRNGV